MDDVISRQVAIDLWEKYHPTIAVDAMQYDAELRQLPPAQPERPKGKWVEKPHVYGVAYCSLCDYELHTNDTNFCPNCGADMRGDQDETD